MSKKSVNARRLLQGRLLSKSFTAALGSSSFQLGNFTIHIASKTGVHHARESTWVHSTFKRTLCVDLTIDVMCNREQS